MNTHKRALHRLKRDLTPPLPSAVMTIQAFLRRVDVAPIADLLLRRGPGRVTRPANFVYFPRKLQHQWRHTVLRKNGLDVGAPVEFRTPSGDVRLTRLPQFLDGYTPNPKLPTRSRRGGG